MLHILQLCLHELFCSKKGQMSRAAQGKSGPPHSPGLTFLEQLLLAAVQGTNLLGHLLWLLSR